MWSYCVLWPHTLNMAFRADWRVLSASSRASRDATLKEALRISFNKHPILSTHFFILDWFFWGTELLSASTVLLKLFYGVFRLSTFPSLSVLVNSRKKKKKQEQSYYYFSNKYTKSKSQTLLVILSNSDAKWAPAYLQPAYPIAVQWKTMLLEEEHGYPTRFYAFPFKQLMVEQPASHTYCPRFAICKT